MNDWLKEYERWLASDFTDEETKSELKSVSDKKEIEDRFYKDLSFGTGGLRGVMGAGTNRMNVYTVGKATQGLANFINGTFNGGSAVIAYDSRNNSEKFARLTACVFAANGIKVYIFSSLRPTPELSFAVRQLKATVGVVVTASHNPPEYNGYKVYFADGGQIVPPYDGQIISAVKSAGDYADIKKTDFDEAVRAGRIEFVGEEIDRAFISEIKKLSLCEEERKAFADKIKIVYTPLCGAGRTPVLTVLKELGFKNVITVKEQEEPDGNFPTLKYPNPEDPAAFTLALALAKKEDADVVLATDPDSDRLGAYVRKDKGEYYRLNGNESGCLMLYYLLSVKKEKGLLPACGTAAIVTTIVSTDLAKAIADDFGAVVIEVLTGFKYIGEQIKLFEERKKECGGYSAKAGAYVYEFGFEESYGSLAGTYARDKDAVGAAAVLAEAAAYYAAHGKTLYGVMEEIRQRYGVYKEDLYTETIPGADGAEKIKAVTSGLRACPPKILGGEKVIETRDYLGGVIVNVKTGEKKKTELPQSDVLYYCTENGFVCARPSGTEPKIKFYFGVKGETEQAAEEKISAMKKDLLSLVRG